MEEMNAGLAPAIELCDEDEVIQPDVPKADMGLPGLNHADLARDFLASEYGKDFYRVYDIPTKPVASWTGTRWVIADDTELLRSGVRDYLNRLHASLPPPEKGRDYRAKLKSAPFCRDTTTEALIKLPPIRQEMFDRDEYLLGLNNGTVAELRTGIIRPMRREDLISRRIYIQPDPDMHVSRWPRFLDEITLSNAELQTFLERLCALCLTAHPFQGLFFFWGKGRNGKGVLLRLLAYILGRGLTATFRPNELTVSRYDEDKARRSFNKLEGTRLATVDESLGSNLNLPILKLMSGGDTLSAARMRQDDRQFKPSHKLILPTNEKPELPNDPAFQGRTYFVPFLADFRDRSKQDPNLEATLRAEAPGILARLIALCPDVVANGLQAPKTVTDATAELLEENDVAKQFQEDMLIDAPGQNVSFDAMESAVNTWLMGGASRGLIAHAHGPNRQAERIIAELKARYTYKRLRPYGNRNRRVYFFLNVTLREEEK
jgi:putative DNA primase/helicase